MAKHLVKCAICGKTFDTNVIQAVRHGARRYAHQTCYPEGEPIPLGPEADPDMINLKNYINQIYGDSANWALINRQIKKFTQENKYSLSGILKSLVFFYDIKKNPVEKSQGGIGIVPYCYQDAYNYYYALYMAQVSNQDKVVQNNNFREITIKPPKRRKRKLKLFNLGEEEE